jgi:hypothetical protein
MMVFASLIFLVLEIIFEMIIKYYNKKEDNSWTKQFMLMFSLGS